MNMFVKCLAGAVGKSRRSLRTPHNGPPETWGPPSDVVPGLLESIWLQHQQMEHWAARRDLPYQVTGLCADEQGHHAAGVGW